MDTKRKRKAARKLQCFIKRLGSDGVYDSQSWREWRKKSANERKMAGYFAYDRKPGMPPITALVKPFFDSLNELIGLNYTPVAHNTLHAFPEGWTDPLRLCRGIIFSSSGYLKALPFQKFFNANEHPETECLPDEPFVATEKHDGHLGIIFWLDNKVHGTTRGDFKSASSGILRDMLDSLQDKFLSAFPPYTTLLVEIIHPNTKVHRSYRSTKLVVIGAYSHTTLQEYSYAELKSLAHSLGLPVTKQWQGTLVELRALVADAKVKNREGYVATYPNGLKVKFKFKAYLGKMFGAKLSYGYLMRSAMASTVDDKIACMAGTSQENARAMITKLFKAREMSVAKERNTYLYGLVKPVASTSYYRATCRTFSKWLEAEQKA